MKPIARIIIPLLCIILGACGLKTSVITVADRLDPGYNLFSKAQQLFDEKSYAEALAAYHEYLVRFPAGSLAAGALMKVGAIHAASGNYPEARKVYQRLIAEYPHSSLVLDARVEILAAFYNEGRYAEVIEQASDFLAETASGIHIAKTNVILGDTYLAVGAPIDAVISYAAAYEKSADSEKQHIVVRFQEAARQLDAKDIDFILGRIKEKFPAGYLMYQQGMNHAQEEKRYADAIRVLAAFVEKFPRHEKAEEAKRLIKEISQNAAYNRHTIGCLLPLSGRYKIYGIRALRGVELALNRLGPQNENSAIKIIIKDTKSDPDNAALAVQELLKENVAAIIGPLVTAEAAAIEAQNSGIPMITLTQKENITQIGDYIFRNFFTPKMQVKTIVSFAVEALGLDSFAVLYPDENYGTTFMNLFWDEVLAQGGTIVGVEPYNSSHTDFADPIKKLVGLYYEVPEDLKAALPAAGDENYYLEGEDISETDFQFANKDTYGDRIEEKDPQADWQKENNPSTDQSGESNRPADQPEDSGQPADQSEGGDQQAKAEEEPEPIVDFDAVFVPDAPQKAGLIIPQLAYYDVREVYLLGTNLWHSDNLIEMSRQYAQGAIMADGFFAQSNLPHVREFVRLFEETYAQPPEFIEAVAYDTAMILFQLVNRPEIMFRSELKDELVKLKDYPGVTGLTSFDVDGEVRRKLHLLQIKGRGFVELE